MLNNRENGDRLIGADQGNITHVTSWNSSLWKWMRKQGWERVVRKRGTDECMVSEAMDLWRVILSRVQIKSQEMKRSSEQLVRVVNGLWQPGIFSYPRKEKWVKGSHGGVETYIWRSSVKHILTCNYLWSIKLCFLWF